MYDLFLKNVMEDENYNKTISKLEQIDAKLDKLLKRKEKHPDAF